jgi:outer membrane protein OmpA-like peptidoglycan-associated protein
MKTATRRTTLGLAAAACALPLHALAQNQDVTLKGMILDRQGNRIKLKSDTGPVVVRVIDSTKIQATQGLVGLRRQDRLPNDLIPGLPIEVSGRMEGPEFVASSITFNPDDLKTAQQIHAGLHGTEERLANVGELQAVGRAKVLFPVGSATLSPEAKQDLRTLVGQAKDYKGYRLAVVGRADPTGNAAANQRLSEQRAQAVSAYLVQSLGVSPGSLLPATAVGDSPVFQDPDPPKSNADARRVTVTIAVSKATVPASY